MKKSPTFELADMHGKTLITQRVANDLLREGYQFVARILIGDPGATEVTVPEDFDGCLVVVTKDLSADPELQDRSGLDATVLQLINDGKVVNLFAKLN